MPPLRNIIVIGGSYVGVNTAQQLATAFSGRLRILLIEKNSHFQHLFAFPRFAITSAVDTHKAFIPFTPGTFANCPPDSGKVIQAKVTKLSKSSVTLDRSVLLDGEHVDNIPYAYLVLATGTKLSAPSTLPGSSKLDGTTYLRKHVQKIVRSTSIVVIGGGAVGVQMATDIKDIYPEKDVTLVHSRERVMNKFHPKFHEIIKDRCDELGIKTALGSRVSLPASGYPIDGSLFNVNLENGQSIPADFAIICTGQIPQSSLLQTLAPECILPDGFIKTLPTLQLVSPELSNVFAVGDIAATGAHKAARPGGAQAELVVKNIQHLEDGQHQLSRERGELEKYENIPPAAIHLTLGVEKSVVFGNPETEGGEPMVKYKDDGRLDMGIDGVWKRRGGGLDAFL